MNNFPSINGDQGLMFGFGEMNKKALADSNNFNSTIYAMKNGSTPFLDQNGPMGNMNRTMMNGFNGMPLGRSVDRKSWKDTKLYKGNSLSSFRENRNDAYKMSEIKKILEEKNEIIRRQRVEIQILKNNLIAKSNEKENGNNSLMNNGVSSFS